MHAYFFIKIIGGMNMKWNNDKIDGLRPRTMKYVDSRLDRITFGNPLNKMIKIFLHRVKSMLKKK